MFKLISKQFYATLFVHKSAIFLVFFDNFLGKVEESKPQNSERVVTQLDSQEIKQYVEESYAKLMDAIKSSDVARKEDIVSSLENVKKMSDDRIDDNYHRYYRLL